MKLYVTPTSPYARLARIAVIEHGLSDQVDVIAARTRTTDSPYYAVNISGRVPYLVLPNGDGFEGSGLICQYFDSIGAGPALAWEPSREGWNYGRLEARAHSFIDGIAVLSRELRRPENERSPDIIAHEEARATRLADWWEGQLDNETMSSSLNMAQMILLAGLDRARRIRSLAELTSSPNLAIWRNRLHERSSIALTMPDQPLNPTKP
ncbi:MAG: glutathione S-transferase family protein [Hyphomicrobiaceae bacterium]